MFQLLKILFLSIEQKRAESQPLTRSRSALGPKHILSYFLKQPSTGFPKKRCSENMNAPNLEENNHAKARFQLGCKATSTWVFSSKFAAFFQNTFS